jgi:hypothetical protein
MSARQPNKEIKMILFLLPTNVISETEGNEYPRSYTPALCRFKALLLAYQSLFSEI